MKIYVNSSKSNNVLVLAKGIVFLDMYDKYSDYIQNNPSRCSWRSYCIAFDALDNDASTDPVYGELSKMDDLRKALNSYIQSGDRYRSGLKDAPSCVMKEYA